MILINNRIKNFIINNRCKNISKINLTKVENDLYSICLKNTESSYFENNKITIEFLKMYHKSNYLLESYIDKLYKNLEYRYAHDDENISNNEMDEQLDYYNIIVNQQQKNVILWMKNIEKKINNLENEIMCSRYCMVKLNNKYYFDLLNEKSYENNLLDLKIRFVGGSLSGYSNIGKKRILITYLKLYDKDLIEGDNIYKYKYLNNNYVKYQIIANTNLFICSNIKVDDWYKEISSIFPLSSIIIMTKTNEFKKYSINEILNSNFVIITFDIFSEYISKNLYKKYKNNELSLARDISDICIENINNVDLLNSKINLLHTFYWKRIIIDGSVNLQKVKRGNYINNLLILLSSKYKWILNNILFLYGYSNFLNNINHIIENIDANNNKSIIKFFFNNLSIDLNKNFCLKDDDNINKFNTKLNTKIEYIDLSVDENNIYNFLISNYDESKIFKYCSNNKINGKIINSGTILDIHNSIKYKNEYKIKLINENIDNLYFIKNKINEKISEKIKLKNNKDISTQSIYYNKIIEENININIENRDRNIHQLKYISNIFDRLYTTNKYDCPICLNTINCNKIMIIECGHIYCNECIDELIKINKKYFKCPECRNKVKKSEVYIPLQNDNNIIKNGTKSNKILNIINNLIKTEKNIVIYSNWTETLKYLYFLLKENNIYSVCLFENNIKNNIKNIVDTKYNNTKDFRYKIYLINIYDGLYGVNLNNCNEIIFIDFLNKEKKKEYEKILIKNVNKINNKYENINITYIVYKKTLEEKYL